MLTGTIPSAGLLGRGALTRTMISRTAGTAIGDMTSIGGLAAAYDGTTNQARAASSAKSAGDRSTGTNGKDWGSGVTRIISQVIIYGSNDFAGFSDNGSDTVQFVIQGSTDNFAASIVDLYTGSSFTPTASQVVTINTGIVMTTAYRYHRVKYVKSISTADCIAAEIQWYEDI